MSPCDIFFHSRGSLRTASGRTAFHLLQDVLAPESREREREEREREKREREEFIDNQQVEKEAKYQWRMWRGGGCGLVKEENLFKAKQ